MLNALPGDKASVRRYVTQASSTSLADGTVAVNVSHSNLRQLVQELRFDLHSLIGDVKRRLYTFNGSAQISMELHLKDSDGNLLARMLDESKPLGYYGVVSGMNIHVVDTDPFSLSRDGGCVLLPAQGALVPVLGCCAGPLARPSAAPPAPSPPNGAQLPPTHSTLSPAPRKNRLDDVSRIQKYQMSDEDYEKREKSYRAWKREKLAADPNWRPPSISSAPRPAGSPQMNPEDFADPACCAGIEVGMRCSISPGDRRGCVGFVGPVEGLAAGWWVGVRLDEPLGKNSGSVGGKAYFEAEDKHGSFIRPVLVSVGEHLRPLWEEEMAGLEEEGSSAAGGAGAGAGAGAGGASGAEAAQCGEGCTHSDKAHAAVGDAPDAAAAAAAAAAAGSGAAGGSAAAAAAGAAPAAAAKAAPKPRRRGQLDDSDDEL